MLVLKDIFGGSPKITLQNGEITRKVKNNPKKFLGFACTLFPPSPINIPKGADSHAACEPVQKPHAGPRSIVNSASLGLRVRPPGIDWTNGPKSKNGKKNGQKIENGPRPEMGKKWPKNGKKIDLGSFFYFLPFLGHFFPISGSVVVWSILLVSLSGVKKKL